MNIQPGTEVEVTYHTICYPIDRVSVYRGKVVKLANWQDDNMLNLSTGDPRWSHRILRLDRILSYKIGNQIVDPKPKTKVENQTWQVTGSKPGTFYTVTQLANGSRTCTCAGYGFRRNCRHIKDGR